MKHTLKLSGLLRVLRQFNLYARTPSIKEIAVVSDKANICDIHDATAYEFTDHERPQKGEILLLKNRFDNYAALKILDIKDRTRDHDIDELTVEYVVNPPGVTDFRKLKFNKHLRIQDTFSSRCGAR